MISDYKKIFQLKVNHSYYEDGVCKELSYIPSDDTKEVFSRYQFKTKINNDGFSLFFSSKNNSNTFLNYIIKATGIKEFEFTIAADENFYQITQWPNSKIGYFSATTSSVIKGAENYDLIKTFNEVADSKKVVKITFNIEDLLNNSGKSYVLNFTAKKTQLSYAFINQSNQFYKKLYIQSVPEIKFSDANNIILENGQDAISFLSENTEIQLSERPKYQLNLCAENEKLGTKRNKVIYRGLPHPNPSVYQILKQENKNIIRSLMYVYI
ncbi:hypothetical protein [Tenacibaculum xiamenense]|uniref:hypothetical protein n=1 Tax=Tenacibaculum xiamenense TaxID=1261553 RepID=UPI003895195C